MAIPNWITEVAGGVHKDASGVNFSDGTYDKLVEMYRSGKLDDEMSQVIEEIEQLRDVMNSAASQVSSKVLGLSAEATPRLPPRKDGESVPFEIGDSRLQEVPTPVPGGKKLPPKVKEPETTKWKEIRFNKRTGTWQTVITIRHTRNFATEAEAVDFTKKASLDEVETND